MIYKAYQIVDKTNSSLELVDKYNNKHIYYLIHAINELGQIRTSYYYMRFFNNDLNKYDLIKVSKEDIEFICDCEIDTIKLLTFNEYMEYIRNNKITFNNSEEYNNFNLAKKAILWHSNNFFLV